LLIHSLLQSFHRAEYEIQEKQAIDIALAEKQDILVSSRPSSSSSSSTTTASVTSSSSSSPGGGGHLAGVDVVGFLRSVAEATEGSIRLEDFFPASMASVLEPLLSAMGYGRFPLRASPFCGFVACLVNTERHRSLSFNRIFDFEKFHREMTPLLPKIKSASAFSSFFLASQIKKILQTSGQGGLELPDLFSYLTVKERAVETQRFIQNMQFLVVHNNMDLGTVDIARRCRCASITTSKATPNGLAAQCTQCI
jgi:uncharacterized radical SAM superfamily Fe-S cluster-containing enzyme